MQKLFETFLPKAYALRMKLALWGLLIFDIILVILFFMENDSIGKITDAFTIILPIELFAYVIIIIGTYIYCLNKIFTVKIFLEENSFNFLNRFFSCGAYPEKE